MNLLELNDEKIVSKTTLSRKLTIGGETKTYPVYRVALEFLYYNDQNDRIATWITQYRNNSKNEDLGTLDRTAYNDIIEGFIIESNAAAIEKTKNNIALVNQREPGVILADGRVIDGNRRFTCLRLLQKEDNVPRYFETVILDESTGKNQKQIKMLELAIQHGEEQRVDYNLIDMALGAYHDIVETGLLKIEEYVSSTNIPMSEVKKKLEVAKCIIEFLEFMKVPGQYHIAREMHVYSTFYELIPLLSRCESVTTQQQLKKSVFSNTMLGSFVDQKKYIRDMKSMMDSGTFGAYIKSQEPMVEKIEQNKKEKKFSNKKELDEFVAENENVKEELQTMMDRAMTKSKKTQIKSKPVQIVSKSVSMLMDVDTRIIGGYNEDEKRQLQNKLNNLRKTINMIDSELSLDKDESVSQKESITTEKGYYIAPRKKSDPIIICDENQKITNLNFPLIFKAIKTAEAQSSTVDCLAFFVNDKYEQISAAQDIHITTEGETRQNFSLNASASSLKKCYLIIKSADNESNMAQQMIEFSVDVAFNMEFDF